MFCKTCGKEIQDNAIVCRECGCPTDNYSSNERSWLVALLLCFFLGAIGAHRFYTGKNGTAILMLILTLTFFGAIISGIWAFIDFILIICGNFQTADGKNLKK